MANDLNKTNPPVVGKIKAVVEIDYNNAVKIGEARYTYYARDFTGEVLEIAPIEEDSAAKD